MGNIKLLVPGEAKVSFSALRLVCAKDRRPTNREIVCESVRPSVRTALLLT